MLPVNKSIEISLRVPTLLAGFGLFLAGCSNVAYITPPETYAVSEQLRVPETHSNVGRFNAQIIFMADQIERNVDRESVQNTFIVTSLSNLNRLSETTRFGRLVSENLIHELQVRRWKIFEVRLTKDIIINETGEFSLSRDIMKIKDIYMVGGIITGTYSVADGHIIVNTRVIDINTGLVVSTAQSHMPVTWFTESLLFNPDTLQPMKISGDTVSSMDTVKKGSINLKSLER